MERKLDGKLGSVGRVGIRNKETKEIVSVYPYRVEGDDQEIVDEVTTWFYPNTSETEKHFTDCFVDALSHQELMNTKDVFVD